MATRHAERGYTLVELMIVISIVGLSIAAGVPSISRRLAEARVKEGGRELVRIGRTARAETASHGTAHLIWIDPLRLEAYVLLGNTSSCLNENWAALEPANPADECGEPTSRCLEHLDLGASSQYQTGDYLTRLQYQAPDQVTLSDIGTAICYTPSGAVFHGQDTALSAVTLSDTNSGAGGGYRFIFRLESQSDGRFHGVPRYVIFPIGGAPGVIQ